MPLLKQGVLQSHEFLQHPPLFRSQARHFRIESQTATTVNLTRDRKTESFPHRETAFEIPFSSRHDFNPSVAVHNEPLPHIASI